MRKCEPLSRWLSPPGCAEPRAEAADALEKPREAGDTTAPGQRPPGRSRPSPTQTKVSHAPFHRIAVEPVIFMVVDGLGAWLRGHKSALPRPRSRSEVKVSVET